jgi:hypothetical protein
MGSFKDRLSVLKSWLGMFSFKRGRPTKDNKQQFGKCYHPKVKLVIIHEGISTGQYVWVRCGDLLTDIQPLQDAA